MKYLQKQLFGCEDDTTQIMLRFNVAMVYLLTAEFSKGQNVASSLNKFRDKFDFKGKTDKMFEFDFEQDECIEDLREELGINCSKLLSSYLPFKPMTLTNRKG